MDLQKQFQETQREAGELEGQIVVLGENIHTLQSELQNVVTKTDDLEGQLVLLGEENHFLRRSLQGNCPGSSTSTSALLSDDTPIEEAFRSLKRLSDAECETHCKYLRSEAYSDVGCLRESMQHKEEWRSIDLPLRIKSQLVRALMPSEKVMM